MSVVTLVHDAGHGGSDPGAVANGLVEKNLTLEIVMRTAKRLDERYGNQVRQVFTRTTDTDVPLLQRSAVANGLPDDAVFVSQHFNAAGNLDKRGFEAYVYGERSWLPAISAAAVERVVIDGEELHVWRPNEHSMGLAGVNHSAPRSYALVRQMAPVWANLCLKHGMPDRGIWAGDFSVLRATARRAILFENGYLSNAQDAALIKSEQFKADLVEAHCNMIGTAFGLTDQTWALPKVKVVLPEKLGGGFVWGEFDGKTNRVYVAGGVRLGNRPEISGSFQIRALVENLGYKVRWLENPPTVFVE